MVVRMGDDGASWACASFRSLRLRELEREVEQRRRQQDDKEGGWRHEQADMCVNGADGRVTVVMAL